MLLLEERRQAGGRYALNIAAAGVWAFRLEYCCCWRRRAGDLHDFVVVVVVAGERRRWSGLGL